MNAVLRTEVVSGDNLDLTVTAASPHDGDVAIGVAPCGLVLTPDEAVELAVTLLRVAADSLSLDSFASVADELGVDLQALFIKLRNVRED